MEPRQYEEGSTRERAELDLLLGNWAGQMTELSMGEDRRGKHFGTSGHGSISFKIVWIRKG